MLVRLRPLPAIITRAVSIAVLIAWVAHMGVLIHGSYFQDSRGSLATDLARYGTGAHWRGVYYRGEKVGFTVDETVTTEDGFELREDGQLQMTLLGATTAALIHTTARVGHDFMLRSFEFSLDPGTGAITVGGTVKGRTLILTIATPGSTRTEERALDEPPMLSLNISRRLANGGLVAGTRHQWRIFDPATLRNAPVTLEVRQRELVRGGTMPIPAFRVEMEFAGLRTTSWITDTGEVIREESPLGLITVREPRERATAMAVPAQIRSDMLREAAVVPVGKQRIDEPRDVRRLRLRLEGVELTGPDANGAGQSVDGAVVELRDPETIRARLSETDKRRYLAPEPFIESDDPAIRAEAIQAVGRLTGNRARAEELTRYVNALLEKKPTVSLPSAREVLRTKIGDCNEHAALYVALARAAGLPARIDVGLTYVRGAFYYHAWPEVYLDDGSGRGWWIPVDPTLNQFPADATHIRLARGGLDKQAAILPLIGRLKITLLELDLQPGSTPILVGTSAVDPNPGEGLSPALDAARSLEMSDENVGAGGAPGRRTRGARCRCS